MSDLPPITDVGWRIQVRIVVCIILASLESARRGSLAHGLHERMAQTQHAALATLLGAGNHDGRAIMATWKKCTGTQREIIFINVDVIAAMRWIETRKHTELYLGGGDTMLIVNETPEFIRNTAPTV